MTDTTFVSKVTGIATGWMQDLNNFYYRFTGGTAKTTPVDGDGIWLWDSVASAWKTLSWANLKATLHTYLAALTDTWAISISGVAATATVANRTDSGFPIIISATTPDIFAAAGNTISYTGTATCTGFVAAAKAGMQRRLICSGACLFTAGANLIIEGIASGATITLAANAVVDVVALTTTQFKLEYTVSGTFTATGVGFTAAPTNPAYFTVSNGFCSLYIPTGTITGTSNSTSFSITGLPNCINPVTPQMGGTILAMDNSSGFFTASFEVSSNVLYIDKTYNSGGAGWTASGTKRLTTSTFNYSMN